MSLEWEQMHINNNAKREKENWTKARKTLSQSKLNRTERLPVCVTDNLHQTLVCDS